MQIITFYCPNPDCTNHNPEDTGRHWCVRAGFHKTKAFGSVARYKCKSCGKGFSDQTFNLNYWLKYKTDFRKLFDNFNSSNSDCFTARHVNLSFDSVQIRRDHLGRNLMFLQVKGTEEHQISESLCADGIESYTLNKYFPNHINLLVGKISRFVYYFTESCQRRKGQMTAVQKEVCKTIYADKSFENSKLTTHFRELLSYLKNRTQSVEIDLHTDEHKTYKTVIDTMNNDQLPGMTGTGISG